MFAHGWRLGGRAGGGNGHGAPSLPKHLPPPSSHQKRGYPRGKCDGPNPGIPTLSGIIVEVSW
ncbi:hypothetical protein SPHINGO391_490290 [Sphingomonas aurantiaca]|uniref:Uncharacterized protein n=1 Tax=Sphingomonas aurantiaca TaxID=185949 RepID=A0A5E8A8A0_9SPHN|nr:hypothetical protein SPHINGO391_490290 [Sphingomonas aurantiaca]